MPESGPEKTMQKGGVCVAGGGGGGGGRQQIRLSVYAVDFLKLLIKRSVFVGTVVAMVVGVFASLSSFFSYLYIYLFCF